MEVEGREVVLAHVRKRICRIERVSREISPPPFRLGGRVSSEIGYLAEAADAAQFHSP